MREGAAPGVLDREADRVAVLEEARVGEDLCHAPVHGDVAGEHAGAAECRHLFAACHLLADRDQAFVEVDQHAAHGHAIGHPAVIDHYVATTARQAQLVVVRLLLFAAVAVPDCE